jgi:acetyl esterase/lipase
VRHCLAALSGRWRDKRLRRAPAGLAVTVVRPDGFRLAGRLFAPRGAAGAVPGMVIAHGWDPQGQRHGLYVALADALARRGYAVLTFNLRGYPGSDLPAGWDGFTIDELAGDVIAALDWLRNREGVDPDRVALLGHSYGADLVIPVLARDPGIWRAIIYGASCWMDATTTAPDATHREFYHERYWRYMTVGRPMPMRDFLDLTEGLYIPNQVDALEAGHPPVLLVDGGDEKGSTLMFSALLRGLVRPPCDYHTIPGTDHFCNTAAFGDLLVEDRRAITAFAEYLVHWLQRPARAETAIRSAHRDPDRENHPHPHPVS